jgi:hypothetical protein
MTARNIIHTYFCLLLLMPVFSNAQRTDLLFLRNGNKITGEIKKLQYGVLTYKTDDVGSLTVKWKDVIRLKSVKRYELTIISRDNKVYYWLHRHHCSKGGSNFSIGQYKYTYNPG